MKPSRGHTLLELLVAIALMALVATFAATALSFTGMATQRYAETLKQGNEIGNVHSRLREWVERAVPIDPFRSTERIYSPLQGSDVALIFSANLQFDAFRDGLSRIRIAFDRGSGELRLQYEPDRNDLSEPNLSAKSLVLLEHVHSANFSYLDYSSPPQWQPAWTDRFRLPSAVRLELDVDQPGGEPIPDLVITPLVEADAWCDFDPVSRGCRASGGES